MSAFKSSRFSGKVSEVSREVLRKAESEVKSEMGELVRERRGDTCMYIYFKLTINVGKGKMQLQN